MIVSWLSISPPIAGGKSRSKKARAVPETAASKVWATTCGSGNWPSLAVDSIAEIVCSPRRVAASINPPAASSMAIR